MSEECTPEPRPMCQAYWEMVSENYAEEIQSVYENDLEGLVRERIQAAGRTNPNRSSADIGCGVGNFTPLLAETFASVEAYDWADTALKKAAANCTKFSNTVFQKLDLSRDPIPFEPVDFAICINVLIMPSFDARMRAWRAVTNQVNQGGTLLLVVPSYESTQMEYYREVEIRLDMGDSCTEATKACSSPLATVEDLQHGIFPCQGTRMKYYLKEELKMLLNNLELDVIEIKPIRYSNQENPAVYETWDWLAMAQRR